MLASTARYLLFVLLALLGPGTALQRVARVRLDACLVLPLGLAAAAGSFWLGAAILLLLDLSLLLPTRVPGRTEGPPLRGAAAPFAALVVLLALTQYGA